MLTIAYLVVSKRQPKSDDQTLIMLAWIDLLIIMTIVYAIGGK